jgi:4-hydroxy-tetrahydrodipicolinate synthase
MLLEGVASPLLTPMLADGAIDKASMSEHVRRLISEGVTTLVAVGTTGEFPDLDANQRRCALETVLEAAEDRVPTLLGIGALGTDDALRQVAEAAQIGARGVLCLPPLGWKLDDEAVFRHFATIASAATVPVVVYDFPGMTGRPSVPALIERIARELDIVVGAKQTVGELRLVLETIERTKAVRQDFGISIGFTELVLPAMLSGADGSMSALTNLTPAPFVALHAAIRRGDFDLACRSHLNIIELKRIPANCYPPALALKAAAAAFGSPMPTVVRTTPGNAEQAIAMTTAAAEAYLRSHAPIGLAATEG